MKFNKKRIICVFISLLALTAQSEDQVCRDNLPSTTPTSRFIINSDNTVNDKVTGLTWMRCSLGQTGNDCNGGIAENYNWKKALDIAKQKRNTGFLGHSDWRVPNIKELVSIAELSCDNQSINMEVFPNTPGHSLYWSSTHLSEKASVTYEYIRKMALVVNLRRFSVNLNLDSSLKCNAPESRFYFKRRSIPKYFSRSVIQVVFDSLNFFISHVIKRG